MFRNVAVVVHSMFMLWTKSHTLHHGVELLATRLSRIMNFEENNAGHGVIIFMVDGTIHIRLTMDLLHLIL